MWIDEPAHARGHSATTTYAKADHHCPTGMAGRFPARPALKLSSQAEIDVVLATIGVAE
jgi:hypothetical protein